MNSFAEIFTDGSCHTQHLIGAWAAVLLVKDQKIILSGKEINTTHNRMEISGVINAIAYMLKHFPEIKQLKVVSDSQYVIGLVGRQSKFELSDYTTKAGKAIANEDLVKQLLQLLSFTSVEFVKIKAHQKQTDVLNYNIEVDKLSRQIVRAAAKKESL